MELHPLSTKHLPKFLPEGRKAENGTDWSNSLGTKLKHKRGIDTNLNAKDLPAMILRKGIGFEQFFSSLHLIYDLSHLCG